MLIEQPFEKISVSELVKKAGVGRVSLYRNFESKEEVPRKHLKTILEKWAASHENISEHELVEAIFEHYYEYKELYILLYNRGLSHISLQSVKDACDPKPEQSNAAAYMSAFFAFGLYGWIEEWFKRGMTETPGEMKLLLEHAQK